MSRPDAPALISGQRTMTYGELNGTADAWAVGLRMSGLVRGDCVPILLPRSFDLVTALLAVLKTGAAYALLDPAWPTPRIIEVTEALGTRLLIARDGIADRVMLPVWSPPPSPVTAAARFRPPPVSDSDPCCVFFTSGTTGRPKGVLTTHRSIARLFQPNGFARFGADTVMPLAAATPWDAFALELWSVLLNGGTGAIVEEPYLSADCLRNTVSLYGADNVWLTSTLFNMIMDEDPDAFRGLKRVMIGGEQLSSSHVSQFLRRHPQTDLINGYGPVESTVFATTHRVIPADCQRPDGIPLGRPVTGTDVYVLSDDRICAVDEVGEICIAGDGLALRYLGDLALTEAKFTRLHLGGRAVRIYRTGDLGTWGTDGLLHFRGRADRQVKIRGYRVEPTEVERQVERLLPEVRACRVLARRDGSGAVSALVAFCVPTTPGDPLLDALPALRSALVPYHQPSALVSVETLPTTDRGKIDDQALLATAVLGGPAPDTPENSTPDRDPVIRLVGQTFGTVLGRAAVPPGVPFIELGGDSLGVGRVCARLAARLGRPVPVSAVYRYPTVSALAGWLSSRLGHSAQPGPNGATEVPLTPMQVVYLVRHLCDPGTGTGHCFLVWLLEGGVDKAALGLAVATVHQRHEPLRASYLPDPSPVARLTDVAAPALVALAQQPSVEAATAALRAELAGPLDLACGEVWRAALIPVGDGHSALFGCAVHHIAFDGRSEAVLAADLATAYNQAREAGQRPALPRPVPPSLARAHQERASGTNPEDLADQRRYLATELAGVPVLRWPTAPTRRAPAAAESVTVSLDSAVVAQADALARDSAVTRFVVLLTCYANSLAEVTGQRDFAVGVPVAQRSAGCLEQAVGCHIAMACIRFRGAVLDRGPSAIRAAMQLVAQAFAAVDVPFADLLELISPPRTGRPPLYQTLFAVQDAASPQLGLAGLRTTFIRQPYRELPLELHAELWPQDDGGLRLTISFRPEVVAGTTAAELANCFCDHLDAICSASRS
jgi:mycobactin peptide synthetase MbtE